MCYSDTKGKRKLQREKKDRELGNNISVSCGVKYKIVSVFNSQTVEERNQKVVKKMYFVC